MEDLEKLGEKLFQGKRGDALRAAASSPAAQRLEKTLDPGAVERAARSGDPAQMKALLTQILRSPDGRALAEMLSRTGGEDRE